MIKKKEMYKQILNHIQSLDKSRQELIKAVTDDSMVFNKKMYHIITYYLKLRNIAKELEKEVDIWEAAGIE